MNLEKVDGLAPKFEYILEKRLSFQERKIVVNLVRCLKDNILSFNSRNVRDSVGLAQHSHFAAVLTRLVRKRILVRKGRGVYEFLDGDMVNHIIVKCLTSMSMMNSLEDED